MGNEPSEDGYVPCRSCHGLQCMDCYDRREHYACRWDCPDCNPTLFDVEPPSEKPFNSYSF